MSVELRPRPLALALVLAGLSACPQPEAEYSPAPAHLLEAWETPPMPSDPADPFAQVMWTLNYDLREFDSTWAWLEQEVEPGPERDRSMGALALLGVAELDRFDLLEAGLEALELAIDAYPEDGRLPAWQAYLILIDAMRMGDQAGIDVGYELLRASTDAYTSFTVFGLTIAVAGDPNATPELIDEALAEYDRMLVDYGERQYSGDPLDHLRSSRLGDWSSPPFSQTGTQALLGDMAARAGDYDRANRHWYTAQHANEGYRWAFRDELAERFELGAEAAAAAMEAGELMPFGARHVGAIGTPEPYRDPRFEGRIGNGSCTMCHTRLTAHDDLSGSSDVLEVGWIRGTMVLPEDVPNPVPALFALPDPDGRPQGFLLGRMNWEQHLDGDPVPVPAPGSEIEYLIPATPGRLFVAGRILVGDEIDYQAYLPTTLGPPRYIEVVAGEVADIRGGRPLVFKPE